MLPIALNFKEVNGNLNFIPCISFCHVVKHIADDAVR